MDSSNLSFLLIVSERGVLMEEPPRARAMPVRCLQNAMSPAQREAYEEHKLKMRKAMADPTLVDEMDQVQDSTMPAFCCSIC